jgi:Peptidase C39 family
MAEPIELSTELLQEPVASCDTAIACLARLSAQNGGVARIEVARGNFDLAGDTLTLSRLVKLAAEFGLHAQWIELDWQGLKTTAPAQPLLVVRNDGDVVVVTGGGRSGAEEVSVWDPHHDGVVFFVSREDFERACSRQALTITPVQAEANVFELQPGRDTTPDTAGADSPAHPDVPKQQTPTSPMRTARASKSTRYGGTLRRSPSLPFGLVATAIVAAAGIALFLLTAPGADHIASPPAPAPVNSGAIPDTLMNGREAASSAGVLATAPVVGTSETTSASATPPSAEPANKPGEAPPVGAPTQEASPASPPTEAAPSAVATPAAQMPQPPATLTKPVPAALPGSVLPASEIAALLAHGDAPFPQGRSRRCAPLL